jgi:hypothetical protein
MCGIYPLLRLNNVCFVHGGPQQHTCQTSLGDALKQRNLQDLHDTLWDRKFSETAGSPPCAVVPSMPHINTFVLGHTPQLDRLCSSAVRHFETPLASPHATALAFGLNTAEMEKTSCAEGTWTPHGITCACFRPDGQPSIFMVDTSSSRSFDRTDHTKMEDSLLSRILFARRPAALVFKRDPVTQQFAADCILVANTGLPRNWHLQRQQNHYNSPPDVGYAGSWSSQ